MRIEHLTCAHSARPAGLAELTIAEAIIILPVGGLPDTYMYISGRWMRCSLARAAAQKKRAVKVQRFHFGLGRGVAWMRAAKFLAPENNSRLVTTQYYVDKNKPCCRDGQVITSH